MKIKRKDLKKLIENFLNEEGTDPGDGSKKEELEGDQTEIGDTFFANQNMRHGGKQPTSQEKKTQAITDFRKGSDRGQFPPMTFGPGVDDDGNLKDGEFTTVHDYHEPDPYDVGAVRQYKKQDYYLGPNEKSVDDPEVTVWDDEDEKTEESPLGTQYSLDDTKPLYRWDDRTITDPGFTAHSDDDFYLEPEDEEGYEASEEYEEPDTEYGLEDESIISKIRNFFSRKK